jgi:ABC-2 type transport system permease protein
MKMLLEIYFMFWRKVLEKLRNPVFIVMGIATPIIYLAFFAPLLKNLVGTSNFPKGDVLDVFVPGMLVMTAFYNGLFSGWSVIDELRSGVIERFRSTAASRFSFLAGPVFCEILVMLLQACIFVLISLPFGYHIHLAGSLVLALLLVLLLALVSSFIHAVALLTKDEDKLAPIVQGVSLPLTLLSGMLLPMSLAPHWLQILAHFNPIYYVVEASRFLSNGQIATREVALAFLIMIPFTVIVMTWATRVFRKAVY